MVMIKEGGDEEGLVEAFDAGDGYWGDSNSG